MIKYTITLVAKDEERAASILGVISELVLHGFKEGMSSDNKGTICAYKSDGEAEGEDGEEYE
jgi:hypothetical protein